MNRRAFLKSAVGAGALAAASGLATPAISQRANAPDQYPGVNYVSPESLDWRDSVTTGIKNAQVEGNSRAAGMYVSYVRYQKGATAPPHTHPDQRIVAVVSGVLYSGIGPEMTEHNLKPLQPGTVIVIPANTPHFGVAKDGEVLLLEIGMGPSGVNFLSSKVNIQPE